MKKSIIISILAVFIAFAFNACNNSTAPTPAADSKTTEKEIYTCTMHPEVQVDKPGDCPKCGMKLVKMETADTTNTHFHTEKMKMN